MIVHFLKSGDNTRSASFLHTKADPYFNFYKGVLLMFGGAGQGTPLHLDWTTAVNLAISVIYPYSTSIVVGKCARQHIYYFPIFIMMLNHILLVTQIPNM
jgi:hypothetical protein